MKSDSSAAGALQQEVLDLGKLKDVMGLGNEWRAYYKTLWERGLTATQMGELADGLRKVYWHKRKELVDCVCERVAVEPEVSVADHVVTVKNTTSSDGSPWGPQHSPPLGTPSLAQSAKKAVVNESDDTVPKASSSSCSNAIESHAEKVCDLD